MKERALRVREGGIGGTSERRPAMTVNNAMGLGAVETIGTVDKPGESPSIERETFQLYLRHAGQGA